MAQTPIPETISYLLAHVGKSHRSYANDLLSAIGLHVGQEMILMCLWQENGLPQSQLAERLGIQLPTVSKMLTRLKKTGLIERRSDAHDCRISRIFLTDRGQALRAPIEEQWAKLEQCTVACLTIEEKILLRRLLMQVYDNLNKT